jgi:hypothetical protein
MDMIWIDEAEERRLPPIPPGTRRADMIPPITAIPPDTQPLNLDTSFVKIGDVVYTLRKVKGKFDINKEAKDWYEKKYNDAVANVNNMVSSGFNTEWDKQINRIEDARRNKQVIIPSELYNKATMWETNRSQLLEIRPAVYHPISISCFKSDIKRRTYQINSDGEDIECDEDGHSLDEPYWDTIKSKFSSFDSQELEITLSNDIYEPILVGFNKITQKVFTPTCTLYHSFTDGRFCIGNDNNYNAFYKMDTYELSIQMSKINFFSLATQSSKINGNTRNLSELLLDSKIIDIKVRGNTWRL